MVIEENTGPDRLLLSFQVFFFHFTKKLYQNQKQNNLKISFKLTKHGLSYSIKSDLRSFSKIKFVQIGAPAPIPYVILRMGIFVVH